ncbi:DNA damage-regulated autophagy modulator protein 2-like isoform X1 [Mizuhopecten yessoensis]|uniref:DNA damage-regulated autophagy modulator protein 2-like isoform X1 n=1 Tax=Mizuhopecten yessoensis TaxID=6573 RepID=UPI000B457FA6|nr:DNA damage-regulated autophagy modulator protein 2-like isoform X1 [Mizuhopecten yessoensis]
MSQHNEMAEGFTVSLTGEDRSSFHLVEEDEDLLLLPAEGDEDLLILPTEEDEDLLLLPTEGDEGSPLHLRERNRRYRHKGSESDIMILGDKLHVVTVITAVYVPVSFLITYAIAVSNGHVEAGFPYISDTGTLPPESCIFGQLLNIGALLAAWLVYIRYKQIQTAYLPVNRQGLLRANTVAFILGLITAAGVSIVGNFQETNVMVVHIIGAFMAFGIGALYCFIQTGMSFKMAELPGSTPFIIKIRVLLCVLDTICFILMITATYVASLKQGMNLNWKPHHPGYAEHLVATISEWLIAIFIVLYFVTFYKEFHKFRMTSPQVVFDIKPEVGNNHLNSQNNSARTTGTEFVVPNNVHIPGSDEGSLP